METVSQQDIPIASKRGFLIVVFLGRQQILVVLQIIP